MPKKLNETFNKRKIVENISKRLDGQISKELLWDCVTYTFSWILQQLIKNNDVTIKNFATFSMKKNTRKSNISNNIYSFYWPKIYSQPILRKIIKSNLDNKKISGKYKL